MMRTMGECYRTKKKRKASVLPCASLMKVVSS